MFLTGLPLLGVLLVAPLTGCDPAAPAGPIARAQGPGSSPNTVRIRGKLTLRFGVYQTDKPTVMYRKFEPITSPLAKALSERLGRPVSIELDILKSYKAGLKAIVDGDVDFMRVGPASYLLATEENPEVKLLAIELKQGQKRFKGVIVVRKESRFQTLSDLEGASFAFGDRNSTIGRYLAQDELVKAGVYASDLSRYDYLDRHDKVAAAVVIGDFDAGAIKIGTLKDDKSGKLRVLAEFDNVTEPWIGREGLSPDVLKALRDSLIGLTDSTALKALEVSGLTETSEDDYLFVRQAMQRAKRFTAGRG